MDIDQNGASRQDTPAESGTESSMKGDETPESTEVAATLSLQLQNDMLTDQDGSVHVCRYFGIFGQN